MIGCRDGALVSGALESARRHGLEHRELTRDEVMKRYPFRLDADMSAVWEPEAGVLFPERCIEAFLEGARAAGAKLRFAEAVSEWSSGAGSVRVATALGHYEAGALVLAGGTGMPGLLPELRDTLTVERQVVAHFRPAFDAARLQPETLPIYCFEERDGAFYYGFPDLGRGCKAGRHHGGATGERAVAERTVSQPDLDDIRAFLDRHLPAVNGEVGESAVCFYTNTPDGHFVLDRHAAHENVVVASVCSGHGFKFSAVVGEIVADLVQGARPAFDLSMFRMPRSFRLPATDAARLN
jgi:sarcosine oxidase